jgi:uncharacterized protein (TIGR03084 family)
MADRIIGICADLEAEHSALDTRVADIDDSAWETPTPADGWAVRDQISHLNYFDGTAVLAMTDPDAFEAHMAELLSTVAAGPDTERGRSISPTELLSEWRHGRAGLLAAIRAADPTTRVPWYGPPMSLASFATARLMETWAHGQDIADALQLPPVASDRLRHVCHIGVGARAYAFRIHGVEDPGDPVRVEATAPSGDAWGWGPEDAPDRLEGPALELALVFTQRRHPDDTTVSATGATAKLWLSVAQAFAGPAGPGRQPGMPTFGLER